MDRPLTGKVALVAGTTRGGGRGIAVALGEAGATVYATGRSTRERRSEVDRPETIEETAELVSAAGGEGIAVAIDHLDPAQVRGLVERIDSDHGRLDVLVNDIWGAEHLFQWNTPLWEQDLDRGLRLLRLAIDTHLITSHALPLLLRRPGGLVVVTDGTVQRRPLPGLGVLRPREDVGDPPGLGAGAGARRAPGHRRGADPGVDAFGGDARAPRGERVELARRHRPALAHFCLETRGTSAAPWRRSPAAMRRAGTGSPCPAAKLAQVYGFTDIDGTRPDCWRYMVEVVEREGAVAGDTGYR